ncbi:adenylate/guanylate cyclase domain-containing protein [Catenovulum sp. SX2]|uniref:adenylate/guanylate cyclase domain-containing protein n=1 Tax=Catenovulum sp. SX2 TaxID=3398614 RepID=UPI003F842B74
MSLSLYTHIANSGYSDRLSQLIKKRIACTTDADKAKIDERIEDLFAETWAIMFTDLTGFSRSVSDFGITHFLQVIYESQRIFLHCVDENDGILIKTEGDSLLIIFKKPKKAIQCALDMMEDSKKYNLERPANEHIIPCIGIGYGEILSIGGQDVFGREVNAASKLGEDTAKSWEILVSQNVVDKVDKRKNFQFSEISDLPAGTPRAYKLIY